MYQYGARRKRAIAVRQTRFVSWERCGEQAPVSLKPGYRAKPTGATAPHHDAPNPILE